MARIAVDAVLLPSKTMTDKAIEANRLLSDSAIVLGKESRLPHISLAMGCIETGDISDIKGVLRQIAEECDLDRLRIAGIHIATNSIGEKVSSFEIERTEPLQFLHEAVMRGLKPYLSYRVTADMVLSPPISESTLRWIGKYPEKAAFEDFSPHITIGYGEIGVFSFPHEFFVSKLALFHLGNHCTCQEALVLLSL